MTDEPVVEVLPDAESAARHAAEHVAAHARAAVREQGAFTLAVSGGGTPAPMFAALGQEDVPWAATSIYQVDERVAPSGDADRNLTHLLDSLPEAARERVLPMPVEADDLEAAAARYAASLPDRFDLIHLGLGPDGHTASLVPGDPVLEVADRDVALTGVYNGRRRMTLTYPVLARASTVLWLVAGEEKAEALRRTLAGDPTIPAGRVAARRAVVVADAAAAGG
ncbi:MAG TPA: 6-phosphogluconolactonase [Gaiellaceae bacterium]